MSWRDIPVIPTIVVLAAVAVMIALGVWQLGRADEKEALLAQFARNVSDMQVYDLAEIDPADSTYRRVRLDCRNPSGWNAVAGRSEAGQSGYVHRYECGAIIALAGTGEQSPALLTGEIGWSPGPQQPDFAGDEIIGRLAALGEGYKIISEDGLAGLDPSAQPDPNDVPNNHLAYAGQWFFFALTALVIYAFALRSRASAKRKKPKGQE